MTCTDTLTLGYNFVRDQLTPRSIYFVARESQKEEFNTKFTANIGYFPHTGHNTQNIPRRHY